MLMAFILSYKVETLTIQMSALYTWETLMTRPIFIGLILLIIILFGLSLKNNKLEYS